MSEKAYAGDIVEIVKPDEWAEYSIGDRFTVDFRQSDLGACDDELLTTTSDEVLRDDEYIIIKKVNRCHTYKEVEKYLSKNNAKLLADFKRGSGGEREFDYFMELVRKHIR